MFHFWLLLSFVIVILLKEASTLLVLPKILPYRHCEERKRRSNPQKLQNLLKWIASPTSRLAMTREVFGKALASLVIYKNASGLLR
ncbi:hypothetical protein BKN38_06755 [Helicobacter sp. CLO-3]|nr:hypothetical protein BA723_09430 [Helicobacter sp. CLO-3]OHU82606.1 hypothetical protein BKN38_06755 [Helicobacter sp. CLO-3]